MSILKSSAAKVVYSTEIRIDHDIMRYVFNGKGKESADKSHMLYEKDDFNRLKLPDFWYYYLNELGQGIAVNFPIKMKTVLSFTKKRYIVSNGLLKLAPSSPIEKAVLFVNRRACDISNI